MDADKIWTGIAPDPAVYSQLDPEQLAVLAHMSWCYCTRNPVLLADLARIQDGNGSPMGMANAAQVIDSLMALRICSVRGHHNASNRDGQRRLSILFGGFQANPRPYSTSPAATSPARTAVSSPTFVSARVPDAPPAAARRDAAPRPRHVPASRNVTTDDQILVEDNLYATSKTPKHIVDRLLEIRALSLATEQSKDDPLKRAQIMLDIAKERVQLFEEWAKAEPGRKGIRNLLPKKRRAVADRKQQLENIKKKLEQQES